MTSSLRFETGDLDLFSQASHDRNPLHVSDSYTRKTPFGERVVFGVLGALCCLAKLDGFRDSVLSSIDVQFVEPMFVGTDYAIAHDPRSSSEVAISILDGSRPKLRGVAKFLPGKVSSTTDWQPGQPFAPSLEAKQVSIEELVPGYSVAGPYEPVWNALAALLERPGLGRQGIPGVQIAALLWTSYLAGMELPGQQALLSRVSLTFDAPSFEHASRLTCRATIACFDQRFNKLIADVELATDKGMLARGRVESFVRPQARITSPLRLARASESNFRDKLGLVVGGSRGLGACTVQALALRGCHVLANFHRSSEEAKHLQASLEDTPGGVDLLEGDGGSREWAEGMNRSLIQSRRRLDILVCCAAPALLPLSLESSSVERINDYVHRSLSLVSVPLAVFLESVAENDGWAVVISSPAVHTWPVAWPHYVSAKAAIEALTAVAARQYRRVSFLIVRPPKLATDLTSSPLAFENPLAPETVAEAIVRRLEGARHPGEVEFMELSSSGAWALAASGPESPSP